MDTKLPKSDLQLVGVTAMLLASKIEEIYTPEIRDFVYITDNAYSTAQIKSCETKMAASLEFNFGDPLCINFLRRNSKAAGVSSSCQCFYRDSSIGCCDGPFLIKCHSTEGDLN